MPRRQKRGRFCSPVGVVGIGQITQGFAVAGPCSPHERPSLVQRFCLRPLELDTAVPVFEHLLSPKGTWDRSTVLSVDPSAVRLLTSCR
ncbi:hypothetical protein WJX73_004228 [Symbiochloris irregularis]|uniref:Uncharacterized protein n=1 Tax=Symbiochloris irregularis TaxID=706552 RepID=A0AAW1NP98_9CHLO